MRSRRVVALLLLAALLLLVACVPRKPSPAAIAPAHTGTQGLVLNFLPNAPPAIIYARGDGSESGINVVVEIRNRGAYPPPLPGYPDSVAATLYLLGFDPKIFMVSPASTKISSGLEGRSAQNPEGGYVQVQFPAAGIRGTIPIWLPEGIDIYPINLQATACYEYSTMASLSVCVDPDPYNPLLEKPCVPAGAAVGGGQGAPVAISSVEQDSLQGAVIFRLRIANVGGGLVLRQGKAAACLDPLQVGFADQDIISIPSDGVTLGTIRGECRPMSELRLGPGGQAVLTCKFPLQIGPAYTTTLNVRLDYGYVSSIIKPLQIKKI